MKIDKNPIYNSSNPTEDNIEYCFSRLLYHGTYILLLDTSIKEKYIYKKIKQNLNYVKKWLKTYIKYKSLETVSNTKKVWSSFYFKNINKKELQ